MFDGIRHYVQLQRLQKQKRRINISYAKLIKEARDQKKDHDELERLGFDERSETDFVDDQIADLHTQYLLNQADKYLFPKPDFDNGESGIWIESSITGRRHLSPQTMVSLRTGIRREQKERRDSWQSVLTLLIGLIGALAALIAVWNK